MSDLIDRQVAIDAIWDGTNYDIYTREVKECLEQLPSAQPEHKTGRWIVFPSPDDYHCGLVKCPFCNEELIASPGEYHFCPNCGARMDDDQEHFKSVDEFVKYATAEAKRELAEEKEDETD